MVWCPILSSITAHRCPTTTCTLTLLLPDIITTCLTTHMVKAALRSSPNTSTSRIIWWSRWICAARIIHIIINNNSSSSNSVRNNIRHCLRISQHPNSSSNRVRNIAVGAVRDDETKAAVRENNNDSNVTLQIIIIIVTATICCPRRINRSARASHTSSRHASCSSTAMPTKMGITVHLKLIVIMANNITKNSRLIMMMLFMLLILLTATKIPNQIHSLIVKINILNLRRSK